MTKGTSCIYWFRKSLRLHDNPALCNLLSKAKQAEFLIPLFILDPHFVESSSVGSNRWRFLMESLHDLHSSLEKQNSQLLIVKGNPVNIIPTLLKQWNVSTFGFEFDSEKYSLERDKNIENICKENNVECIISSGHTLYDLDMLVKKSNLGKGKYMTTYATMTKLINKIGKPNQPLSVPDDFLSFPTDENYFKGLDTVTPSESLFDELQLSEEPELPSVYPKSPGYSNSSKNRPSFSESHCYFIGGETEALSRLSKYTEDEDLVLSFEKPKTSPNSLIPSTTTLSPYLKFGCISPRTVWHAIQDIIDKNSKKEHSSPPVSLIGQLYWREFFYFASYTIPNFDKMEGNPICKQIDYSYAETSQTKEYYEAWSNAKTGYPWIDALMTQLHQHGWIHHLGRHSVACFLTRGDLYVHWELGRDVFDKLLLDSDWALNNANWMWLSASAFYHQYYRVYSPISFGKKTDKNGDFIRHFIPILKDYPAKYIYEPWKAPMDVQKKAGCIIGKDYPNPIVDHDEVRVKNLDKMKIAYESSSSTGKKRNPPPREGSPERKKAKIE